MAIKLSQQDRQQAIESVKRYFAEHMEEQIGDLKATLLLDFCLAEIGPSIYNKAIADAQACLQERVGDLDGTCFEREFGYWS